MPCQVFPHRGRLPLCLPRWRPLPRLSHPCPRFPAHRPPRCQQRSNVSQPENAWQVTVLCGLLASTTTLADRLGVETCRHLIQTFHTLAQDCVQRYEGIVQTLGAEGVLALFGIPVAQEEHAWHAVQAALDLQQRLREASAWCALLPGEALTARVGVHTGWVVVGSPQAESLQAVVIGGETIQGAMHVQALAEPGTLVVSETTLRLLRVTVHSTASGLVHIAGYADPLMASTVQGMETSHAPRVWGPFVGRHRELAVCDDLLARTLGGQGQVVGLMGEPGMGKSRLLREFQQRLSGEPVTVLEGYCRSYARFLPYGPMSDLLRQHCGLSVTAPADVVAARVEHLLRALGLSPEECAPYLRLLLDGSPTARSLAHLAPDVIKARTFATLRQIHLRSSQQQPLLLVVDNLHWLDPTSEAYLASLVEQLAGYPLLLLTTYRPGYHPPWMGKSYATQLTLPPLTQGESRTLVGALWPPAQQRGALLALILTRAQGNPLFLEELTRAVQEPEGLALDYVPETVQTVLAARIARLPLGEQQLLHTAAVIGTEVSIPLLAAIAALPEAVLQDRLAHLQEAEFLYETRRVPEQVYTFKHVLTHEVAYQRLLQEQQRRLHAQIVAALEVLAPERVAERVERLAHHALQGGVWDKAVTYCQQAGARARDRAAPREAAASYEQALQALAHLPEHGDTQRLAIELRLALGVQLSVLGEYGRCLTLLAEAEILARALDDRAQLVPVLARMAQVRRFTGDYDGAIAAGRQGLELAVALGDRALQARAAHHLGQAYYALGDFGRAAELLRWNVETANRASGTPSHRLDRVPGLAGADLECAWGLRRGPASRGGGAPPRHAGKPRGHTHRCPWLPWRAVPHPRGPGARYPGIRPGPGPLSCLRHPGLVTRDRDGPGLRLYAPGTPHRGVRAAGGGDQRKYPHGHAAKLCLRAAQ